MATNLNKGELVDICAEMCETYGAEWLVNNLVECMSQNELQDNLEWIVAQHDMEDEFPALAEEDNDYTDFPE